jgi:hypothetical protein
MAGDDLHGSRPFLKRKKERGKRKEKRLVLEGAFKRVTR